MCIKTMFASSVSMHWEGRRSRGMLKKNKNSYCDEKVWLFTMAPAVDFHIRIVNYIQVWKHPQIVGLLLQKATSVIFPLKIRAFSLNCGLGELYIKIKDLTVAHDSSECLAVCHSFLKTQSNVIGDYVESVCWKSYHHSVWVALKTTQTLWW